MEELRLERELKESHIAYIFLFLMGAHYAYLGKWGLQILFWVTLGGLGIWLIVDLFRIPDIVRNYNEPIYVKLSELKRRTI